MWKCYKQKELLKALTSTDNDETRKEFCVKFGVFLKNHFCASIQQSFLVGELSASQKQAIIKLIKKKRQGQINCRYETYFQYQAFLRLLIL